MRNNIQLFFLEIILENSDQYKLIGYPYPIHTHIYIDKYTNTCSNVDTYFNFMFSICKHLKKHIYTNIIMHKITLYVLSILLLIVVYTNIHF